MEAFHLHPGSPKGRDPEKRAISRALRFALIASVLLAAILLGILATATGNTGLFQEHYPLLLRITLVVAGALLVLVLELLRRLVIRYRRGLFGTRLMARMATVFVLMTVLPVAMIFVVAVQFIGRSVESWFDIPVEQALESGLNLGRASLDSLQADLIQKARVMSIELGDQPVTLWALTLNRLRDQTGVQDALIASGSGRVTIASGGQYSQLVPDLPPADAMRQVRLTRLYAGYEGGDAAGTDRDRVLRLRVIVPIVTDSQRLDDSRYLQLLQPVPSALALNAERVQQGYGGYKALSATRQDLKKLYRITLSLIFLLTVFSAVAGAFLLAGWLTGPLSELAAATRAVAEGDFRQVKSYTGRDELGVLTQSFNTMTRQLEEARELVERNQRELEQANARLESVLSNLNAGVLVLDSDLRVTLANPGADRILGLFLGQHLGKPLASVPRIGALADEIRGAFNEQAAAGVASWQRQFALKRVPGTQDDGDRELEAASAQTILARGSILPERRVGYVIVFDDISGVISAQRAVAWTEVARRLAHEIKNPLTPIQLAAERMQLKLRGKLAGTDAELLDKSSQTIINQVAALKLMVDEFRDYSRMPAARLEVLNLNELIEDVLHLYGGPEHQEAIGLQLEEPLHAVLGDRSQLRQVIHNLLKNALEATEARIQHAAVPAGGTPTPTGPVTSVELSTSALALADGTPAVRMMVRDHGSGFSASMLARAFEPYVTSKSKGTGLGLAIVKKIVEEHGARIDVGNWMTPQGEVGGAQVAILFTKLPKSVDNPGFAAAMS